MSSMLSNEFTHNGDIASGGRFFTAAIVATLVLAVLFWAMQYMIKNGAEAETEYTDWVMPDFERAKVIENKVQRRKPLKKPQEPNKPPKQPPRQVIENMNVQASAISVSAAPVKTNVSLSGSGFTINNISEGDYLPIVKIAPIYPPKAAERGVEGQCTVVYTVTTNGSTAGIYVDPNECSSSLFHTASIKAARKFKYKPTVRNGEAVEVANVKNRFTYKLKD